MSAGSPGPAQGSALPREPQGLGTHVGRCAGMEGQARVGKHLAATTSSSVYGPTAGVGQGKGTPQVLGTEG